MTSGKKQKNLIKNMFSEAQAYQSLDNIELFVQSGHSLAALPVQPLYVSLRSLPTEQVAQFLPKLSVEQRKTFLNLDLWYKDDIDPKDFYFWVQAYHDCPSDVVKAEFVKSTEFLLYLKSRFNIWTFDAEDPMYPEHDNYFLTDDNLLLFEFDEEFDSIDFVQNLVRGLYSELGVENAYSHLFKMISDGFMTLQEEEYRLKKLWLSDYGFVDYYDALDIESTFQKVELVENFIRKKKTATGTIDLLGKNQVLHKSALIAFQNGFENVFEDLEIIEDQKRTDFLKFNFLKLVNANISAKNALKDGSLVLSRIGNNTRLLINLGYSYVKYISKDELSFFSSDCKSYLEIFDFIELYRIGNSLIQIEKKSIKKSLREFEFDSDSENFLGQFWIDFLDDLFDTPAKIRPEKTKAINIETLEQYFDMKKQAQKFCSILPFSKKFYDLYEQLKNENKIHDSFYLNYNVDEIDLESILLSSLINSTLGNFERSTNGKMGITIEELIKFGDIILDKKHDLKSIEQISANIEAFTKKFGLAQVSGVVDYLYLLMKEHLEGYDFKNLKEEEFKHVGGPIILDLSQVH